MTKIMQATTASPHGVAVSFSGASTVVRDAARGVRATVDTGFGHRDGTWTPSVQASSIGAMHPDVAELRATLIQRAADEARRLAVDLKGITILDEEKANTITTVEEVTI